MQLVRGRSQLDAITRDQDQGMTVRRKLPRQCQSDSARGSRDEGRATFRNTWLRHGSSPIGGAEAARSRRIRSPARAGGTNAPATARSYQSGR
jgi:hypothetical protein